VFTRLAEREGPVGYTRELGGLHVACALSITAVSEQDSLATSVLAEKL
jgi:hypothetical protein